MPPMNQSRSSAGLSGPISVIRLGRRSFGMQSVGAMFSSIISGASEGEALPRTVKTWALVQSDDPATSSEDVINTSIPIAVRSRNALTEAAQGASH